MISSQVSTKSRLHPIGEPEHPHQIRAIGFLWGCFTSVDDITLMGNLRGKSLRICSEVFSLIPRLVKSGVTDALFVVWPRTKDGFVTSLEVIGVWKPSILAPDSGDKDDLPEGENWFSIRGEVDRVGKSEYGRYVCVHTYGSYYVSVDFQQAPYLQPGDFVSLVAILTVDGRLNTEQVEKISIPEAAVARPHQSIRPGRKVRRRSSAVN